MKSRRDGEGEQRHGEVYVPVWMASVNSLGSVLNALHILCWSPPSYCHVEPAVLFRSRHRFSQRNKQNMGYPHENTVTEAPECWEYPRYECRAPLSQSPARAQITGIRGRASLRERVSWRVRRTTEAQ